MNITEFLSYKNLDQKQANMMLEMIDEVSNKTPHILQNNSKKPTLHKYTEEEIKTLETKISWKLPENIKWFLQNVGEGYCPGAYFFAFSTDFNNTFNANSANPEDWMFTVMNFGCTLFGVIMLKGKYAGMFSPICGDDEYDDSDVDYDAMTDEEMKKYDAELMQKVIDDPKFFQWQDFIEWYKERLVSYT